MLRFLHPLSLTALSLGILTGCAPVDRVTVGFGHDFLLEPEHNRMWYEQTKKSAFINPIVRFAPVRERESYSIHPVVEFELTDEASNFAGVGGEFVYPLFESGELNVLGTAGMHHSDFTQGGPEEIIENLSFGFSLGYTHELDPKTWLGIHYNHLSDAEIGKYNNVTRDGLMVTIGYGF